MPNDDHDFLAGVFFESLIHATPALRKLYPCLDVAGDDPQVKAQWARECRRAMALTQHMVYPCDTHGKHVVLFVSKA